MKVIKLGNSISRLHFTVIWIGRSHADAYALLICFTIIIYFMIHSDTLNTTYGCGFPYFDITIISIKIKNKNAFQ